MIIEDRLPTHPKMLRAGERLGHGGLLSAFYLYVSALAYARTNLTDGFVPSAFVIGSSHIADGQLTAAALSARGVRLWRKVRGGYRIVGFHDYNPTATSERTKRARYRRRGFAKSTPDPTAGSARRKSDPLHSATTRNRNRKSVRTYGVEVVPTRVLVPTSKNKRPRAARPTAAASKPKTKQPRPPADAGRALDRRQLTAIARSVVPRDRDPADWKERVKLACARQGWRSPPADMLASVLDSVEAALDRRSAA